MYIHEDVHCEANLEIAFAWALSASFQVSEAAIVIKFWQILSYNVHPRRFELYDEMLVPVISQLSCIQKS